MFVSNAVLSWRPEPEGNFSHTCDDWDLPYTYLRHSEELLRQASEKRHVLIDVISNLKRAVDHRIKHISKTYNIKKTVCYAKHKNVWDSLAEVDVIRPVMLHKLLEIRNGIEHQFSDPPSQSRCLELSEFAWYFLKSTDQIAKLCSEGVVLRESLDSPYFIGLMRTPESNWKPSISLVLPGKLVSRDPKPEYFEVSEEKAESGQEYKATLLMDSSKYDFSEKDRAHLIARHNDDDMMITGRLKDAGLEVWFLKVYFETT